MRARLSAYLQVAPLTAVFVAFFVLPITVVIMVSFFDYQAYQLFIPAFTLQSYADVFASSVTYRTYLITLRLCVLVWALTLLLGFPIAYFLAFHVRSQTWQMVLLLLCTIPFWTSNVIRMIAWIPLLGRHGVVNTVLQRLGVVDAPLEWLLYSEFAVVVGYIHLYTLFMIVPIFNAMMRMDRTILEAAGDSGATEGQTLWHVIAAVMGDFVTVNILGGGQIASVGKAIVTELAYLQFPPAAANAMVLLTAVLLMIVLLIRLVDIRKEL